MRLSHTVASISYYYVSDTCHSHTPTQKVVTPMTQTQQCDTSGADAPAPVTAHGGYDKAPTPIVWRDVNDSGSYEVYNDIVRYPSGTPVRVRVYATRSGYEAAYSYYDTTDRPRVVTLRGYTDGEHVTRQFGNSIDAALAAEEWLLDLVRLDIVLVAPVVFDADTDKTLRLRSVNDVTIVSVVAELAS